MALAVGMALTVKSAEWPWSVAVPSVMSKETLASSRVFLWIPPTCERARAVVVGSHNMLAELGFAEVWIPPPLGGQTQFGVAERARLEELFGLLAKTSGYDELEHVPAVPLGHSAMADFSAS